MNNTDQLINALFLTLTAPEDKLRDAIHMAESIAASCTPSEVEEAQECALYMWNTFTGAEQ